MNKIIGWMCVLGLLGACDSSTVDTPMASDMTDAPDPTTPDPTEASGQAEEVRETVTTSGSELALTTGERVDIPDGALTEETEIVVTADEAPPQPVVEGFALAGSVLTLEPHGQSFDEPVELTLQFTRDPDVEPYRYSVQRLADENDTTWERVENAYPAADGTVSFTVQTFSVLAVVEREEGCLETACADNEEYYSARYLDCVGNGNSEDYCSGWIGCAGSFTAGNLVASGDGELCETPCDASACVNGTCQVEGDGATSCLCFGGFEGELCDTPVDLCPGDPDKTTPGACGCGTADTDSDQDQTPDCLDACPDDTMKVAAGACGCGIADTDTDQDEVPDCSDACPDDMNKTAAGACGCGVSDEDSDLDETPDCLDTCPDDADKTEPGECGCGQDEGTCEPVCPCFDAAMVAKVAGGLEAGCNFGFQSELFIYTGAQGGFFDAQQTLVYATLETREYYDEQGFECAVNCGEAESLECTPTVQSIDEATHQACELLFSLESNCQSSLP